MPYRTALLPALALLLPGLGACSAEATATNHPDDDRSTETADPAFYRDVAELLLTLDEPPAGRARGVILSENEDGLGSDWVVGPVDGTVLLEPAANCSDDGDSTYESDLWQLLDPGDLITWSTEGDDTAICTGEVEIARKAAVTP